MKNCVIYLRVAKRDDYEINIQGNILTKFMKEKNFVIKKFFIDNGYNGLTFNRPGFKEMMEYIENNKVDVIAVMNDSRITRNIHDKMCFTNKIKEKNIKIVSYI